MGKGLEGRAHTRVSLVPERWIGIFERACAKEDHRGKREGGRWRSVPLYQTGEESDHFLINLSQVNMPFAWKKWTRGRGGGEIGPFNKMSKPIWMLAPEEIFHRRFAKKKCWSFLKPNQIAEPLLFPKEFLLYQKIITLPFRYFLLMSLLHGPFPKIPLWREEICRWELFQKISGLKGPSHPRSGV